MQEAPAVRHSRSRCGAGMTTGAEMMLLVASTYGSGATGDPDVSISRQKRRKKRTVNRQPRTHLQRLLDRVCVLQRHLW